MQADLFQHNPVVRSEKYPDAPGWKRTDTSRQAAIEVKPRAKVVRERVHDCLLLNPQGLTTEEITQRINVPYHTVQPRLSELREQGKIMDSGKRRRNANGKHIIVWQAIGETDDR